MCYICNCFAWTLDLVQRFITFALGCVMALAICCGMTVAIVAGIAYGYNYSLAEFLTFSRSDITVYMRRGQFFDKPDLQSSRRSGDDTYDLLSSNITSDYQEESLPEDTNPLSNTWLKAEDTRRYAEKLTKYSSKNRIKENLLEAVMRADNLYYKLTTAPQRQISIAPNRGKPTVMVQSGSSDIMMREFRPVEQLTSNPVYREYDYVNFDKSEKAKSEASEQSTGADTGDVEIQLDSTSNYAPMRSWGTTNSPRIVMDYPTEDTDDDNIVYKPV